MAVKAGSHKAPLIFRHFTSSSHLWLLAAVMFLSHLWLGLNWLLGSEFGGESYGTNKEPLI